MNMKYKKKIIFLLLAASLILSSESIANNTNNNSYDEAEGLTVFELKEMADSKFEEFNLSGDFRIYDILFGYGDRGVVGLSGEYEYDGKNTWYYVKYFDNSKPFNNTTFICDIVDLKLGNPLSNTLVTYENEDLARLGEYGKITEAPEKNPKLNVDSDEALEIARSHPRIKEILSNEEQKDKFHFDFQGHAEWINHNKINGSKRFCYFLSFHYGSDAPNSPRGIITIDVETGEIVDFNFDLEDTVEEADSHMEYYITGFFLIILIFIIMFYFSRRKQIQRCNKDGK